MASDPHARSAPIRLLLVEDVATDAELEIRELRRAGIPVEHRLTDDEAGFRAEVERFAPQLIISDFSMPHFDGMAALALARELCPEVPFIFVSGTIGEEYAIRALKNGATDYVLKTNLVRLPVVVERALHEARERALQRATERALNEARQRLTDILATLPDVLWSFELPDTRVIYVSPAVAEVFGRPAEAFQATPRLWADVIHPEDRARAVQARRDLIQGESYDIEYRVVLGDGTTRWIHDRARLILDPSGRPIRVDGLARDVSEAVRQRARLARLSRIRDLLGAVSVSSMRIRERNALYTEFCAIAAERGGFTLAGVLVPDERGALHIRAISKDGTGLLARLVEAHNRHIPADSGLLGQALRTRSPLVCNDLGSDQRLSGLGSFPDSGPRSMILLPVQTDEAFAALAILGAGEADFFDQEEVGLLIELTANLRFTLELQSKQSQLDYLALYDPLTGLPNRRLFHERLTQLLDVQRRESRQLSLTLIDLERFKAFNDSLGQAAGDQVLKAIATRLSAKVGDTNRLARLGGNLFAVVRPDISDATDVVDLLNEKLSVISLPLSAGGREVRVKARAGIALHPDDGADADTLFRNAEASLKRAKETGERYMFYAPDINARVAEQVEFEINLRQALDRRELVLHFQPKVELGSRRITGLEALMRWNGPDGRPVSPARFVPVLEETGMIIEASRLAFELAVSAHRDWSAKGLKPPRIAVNVSARHLQRPDFVRDVMSSVGRDGEGIDIEITESLLMRDVNATIGKLGELRAAGMGIALDDFGTGYSSLAYLSRLPIDTLKIDRSFVHGMTEKVEDTSIVTTIISLAQALRLNVVAEGVETEEQARLLRLLRCGQMQGYLFSPPVAAEAIETLLREQASTG